MLSLFTTFGSTAGPAFVDWVMTRNRAGLADSTTPCPARSPIRRGGRSVDWSSREPYRHSPAIARRAEVFGLRLSADLVISQLHTGLASGALADVSPVTAFIKLTENGTGWPASVGCAREQQARLKTMSRVINCGVRPMWQ